MVVSGFTVEKSKNKASDSVSKVYESKNGLSGKVMTDSTTEGDCGRRFFHTRIIIYFRTQRTNMGI